MPLLSNYVYVWCFVIWGHVSWHNVEPFNVSSPVLKLGCLRIRAIGVFDRCQIKSFLLWFVLRWLELTPRSTDMSALLDPGDFSGYKWSAVLQVMKWPNYYFEKCTQCLFFCDRQVYSLTFKNILYSRSETCSHCVSHCWHHQRCGGDGSGARWVPRPPEWHSWPQRQLGPGGERGRPPRSGKVAHGNLLKLDFCCIVLLSC